MCFFPLFSSPPKRRYSALYSDDELPPPRKKRMTRQPEMSHSQHETLRGQGVKRSPPKVHFETPHSKEIQVQIIPLRGHGVKRDPPKPRMQREEREPIKRPAARNSHRRPSTRNVSRRQSERTTSRQRPVSSSGYAQQYYSQVPAEPPIDINYHSNYICNTAPRYHRDDFAVRAATNQALRGLYHEPAQPAHNLRRQPAYGALRYQEVPWQWQ